MSSILEALAAKEKADQENFKKGHRRTGIHFLRRCQKPDVVPYLERVRNGVPEKLDICQTCRRIHIAFGVGVIHTGA